MPIGKFGHAIMVLILMLSPWTSSVALQGGNHGGGGGNVGVAEFAVIMQAVVQQFDQTEQTPFGLSAKQLQDFFGKVRVAPSTGPLYLRGQKVDAINYPSRRQIILDEESYRLRTKEQRVLLVIHEMIGVLRDPLNPPEMFDPNYADSTKILLAIVKFNNEFMLSTFDQILMYSRPDSLKEADCKIFDHEKLGYVTPVAIFKLPQRTCGGGLCGDYTLPNRMNFDVYISWGNNRRISLTISRPCKSSWACPDGLRVDTASVHEIQGQVIDAHISSGGYSMTCTTSSAK